MTENPTAADAANPTTRPRPRPDHDRPRRPTADAAEWPVPTSRGRPPRRQAPNRLTDPEPAAAAPSEPTQSSLAAPRGLSYAVDIVFCIDVTGSMTPIIDAVKANALGFYDDVQTNLTAKGKNVAQLRVRVVAFRDFVADGDAALEESPFYTLPDERNGFSEFVNGLIAAGRRRRARVGSGGGGPGHQLAVDHHRRPPPAGHRGLDRPARPARSTRPWCRPTSPRGCLPTSAR